MQRFATGAASETMPNVPATSGSVVTCATRVAPRSSATFRARAGSAAAVHATPSPPKMRSPPTARTDSAKPTSKTDQGDTATITTAEAARPESPSRLSPPNSLAAPAASITHDRTAASDIPLSTVNPDATASTSARTSERGRRVRAPRNSTSAHTTARCDPDTATTCESPSTRKSSSAAEPVSSRRSPSTIPRSSAPASPGTRCSRATAPALHRYRRLIGSSCHATPSTR